MLPVSPVTNYNFEAAIALLQKNNLPTQDITNSTSLFVITEASNVIATIGIEYYDDIALLRSLAVAPEKRGLGLGQQMITFLENYAQAKGVKELLLLTTTAANYFDKRNYERVERTAVPEAIKKSSEFLSVCPSSAIIMKKILE